MITDYSADELQRSNDMKSFSARRKASVQNSPKETKRQGWDADKTQCSPSTNADWPKGRQQAKYRKIPERPSKTRDAGGADAKFFRVWEQANQAALRRYKPVQGSVYCVYWSNRVKQGEFYR